MAGDWMEVVPPSTSASPAAAPASRPVTRSLVPETVVASCLAPPEFVACGTPRSHWPVVAVSVPAGLVVQPLLVSKSSKKTVTGGGGGVPPSTALPVTTRAKGWGPFGTLKERTVTVYTPAAGLARSTCSRVFLRSAVPPVAEAPPEKTLPRQTVPVG